MLRRFNQDVELSGAEVGTGATPHESANEGLPKRVLVAEDNVVSRQVAKRYLEAIGCDVLVVEDGVAAVDACLKQDFGLVLMDLQMPRMDGIRATGEIRRQERSGRRVPILALTARDAADELARCTAAGMDGVLTKPLEMTQLRQTLGRFGVARGNRPARNGPARDEPARDGPADPIGEPVDLVTLQAKFAGDVVFMRHLCQAFIGSTSKCLNELDRAVAAGERERIRLTAHKIKGGGASIHAHRLTTLAAYIEQQSMTEALTELASAAEALRSAFDEVTLHIGAQLP
jgi:CheY-like chemotaxis protein